MVNAVEEKPGLGALHFIIQSTSMPESAAALDNCVARSFRSAEDLDVHAYY
jgi:hypothetical protein